MADERRNFNRVGLRFNISYTIVGTKKVGAAVTSNVSGAGLRFLAEHPLVEGDRLDLRIVLPDRTQPVACLGEVVWCRSAAHQAVEVGVRFVTITEDDRRLLAQYAMLYPET